MSNHRQTEMFPDGSDLPLFSGAPQRAEASEFKPAAAPRQLTFAVCPACLDGGEVDGQFCWCPAGQKARAYQEGHNRDLAIARLVGYTGWGKVMVSHVTLDAVIIYHQKRYYRVPNDGGRITWGASAEGPFTERL